MVISCIICSRQVDISAELKENIESTIGCEYELVVIDNSKNDYSIFSAYNEGVHRAKGDMLCFMHEDILYHTKGWGIKVAEYFAQYPKAGLIGVAGTHYLSSIPSGWWDAELNSGNIMQGYVVDGCYQTRMDNWSQFKTNPTQVVAVDGVWMCMLRSIFDEVKWDNTTFDGFHGYDIDMSLQIWKASYEVHIVWDVLIEHKSPGVVDVSFYDSYKHLWTKWTDCLPLVKGSNISASEQEARNRIVELKAQIIKRNTDVEAIYKSHAYRLGKFILKPFLWLRNLLKCNKK